MATKTNTLEAEHTLRRQLAAGAVDAGLGVIRDCVVVEAGVPATGKYVLLDASGNITRDEKLAKKKIPVFTDEKTLDTLLTAAAEAGKRVRTREDHDETIGARAGFSDAFKRVKDQAGDRVVADVHLFKSYRHRDILLETAAQTPDEVGLSIDFTPSFELAGEKAFMRVAELHAVDIVDTGAVTPGGLFLSARVDTNRKSETKEISETQPPVQMAATPSNDEIMAALSALTKTVGDCMAAVTKLATPPAKVPDVDNDGMKAIKAEQEKLAAEVKAQAEQLKASQTTIAQMRKEKALLGLSATERAAAATASVEDTEKMAASKKDYLTLVAERVDSAKCKRSEAHLFIQRNHREAYAAHLLAKGVYDPAKANMKAA